MPIAVSLLLALPVIAVLAVLSPHLGRSRRVRSGRPPGDDDLSPERVRWVVRRLDLAGLCSAWRSSEALLVEIEDLTARGLVVMMRQQYLEELERRDESGFRAWLEARTRGAADPQDYLASGPGRNGSAAA